MDETVPIRGAQDDARHAGIVRDPLILQIAETNGTQQALQLIDRRGGRRQDQKSLLPRLPRTN